MNSNLSFIITRSSYSPSFSTAIHNNKRNLIALYKHVISRHYSPKTTFAICSKNEHHQQCNLWFPISKMQISSSCNPSISNTLPVSSSSLASCKSKEGYIRLSKRMSELDICSRREADKYIQNQQVAVKGKRVPPTLGIKVKHDELDIQILHSNINDLHHDGSCDHVAKSDDNDQTGITMVHPRPEMNHLSDEEWDRIRGDTVVLHKPIGYVSGQPDPKHGHIPAVRLLTRSNLYIPPHDPTDENNIAEQPTNERNGNGKNSTMNQELKEILSTGKYFHFGKKFIPRSKYSCTDTATDTQSEQISTLLNYAPAGRLDLDSSGLLIFTKNGVIAKKLLSTNNTNTQPSSSSSSKKSCRITPIPKEYIVHVQPVQSLTKQEREMGMNYLPYPPRFDLSILLRGGRRLWNDDKSLKPLIDAEWIKVSTSSVDVDDDFINSNPNTKQTQGKPKPNGNNSNSNNNNNKTGQGKWNGSGVLRLVLQEGKKRQIRRMCRELLGLHVTKLVRTKIGDVSLHDLPEGCWRPLCKREVESLLFPSSLSSTSSNDTSGVTESTSCLDTSPRVKEWKVKHASKPKQNTTKKN